MAVTENTLQQLAAFGFNTCALRLADGSQLEVRDVVRTVPGKRLVCRCIWNSQNVYAKIFVGKNAVRQALPRQLYSVRMHWSIGPLKYLSLQKSQMP